MRAPVRFALSHCLFEALDGCVQKRVEFFNRNVVFEFYVMVFALSDAVSEVLQRSDVCASACASTFSSQRVVRVFFSRQRVVRVLSVVSACTSTFSSAGREGSF